MLPGVSGNSSSARRFRDLVRAYLVDLGGLGLCSEIKLGLLRRLAATTVQCELLEADVINGKTVDTSTQCTLASTAMRLSSRLGLGARHRTDFLRPVACRPGGQAAGHERFAAATNEGQ